MLKQKFLVRLVIKVVSHDPKVPSALIAEKTEITKITFYALTSFEKLPLFEIENCF
jgi:hypothetical protein